MMREATTPKVTPTPAAEERRELEAQATALVRQLTDAQLREILASLPASPLRL